jgi:hypothetical protein
MTASVLPTLSSTAQIFANLERIYLKLLFEESLDEILIRFPNQRQVLLDDNIRCQSIYTRRLEAEKANYAVQLRSGELSDSEARAIKDNLDILSQVLAARLLTTVGILAAA